MTWPEVAAITVCAGRRPCLDLAMSPPPPTTTTGVQMTTTTAETEPAETSIEPPALTELIAEQLCHTRVIGGQHHRFEAVDHGDGRIELDVTRIEFAAESDTTMRLLLLVSRPLTPDEDVVEAEIVDESAVEVGVSA